MNPLKFMFIVLVLAVIFGVMWVTIFDRPEPTPPPEVADPWPSPPKVEVPETATAEFPFGSPGTGGSVRAAPAGSGGLAPPFTPDQPSDNAVAGGMATPFPPSGGSSEPAGYGPTSGVHSNMPPASDPTRTAAPPLDSPGSGEIRREFANFIEAAYQELQQGNLAEVHQRLSLWYDSPQLTPEEAWQLTELLDQVAGTVIYSREHTLEPPYTVKSGETLQRIAEDYSVPWRLLAKINGIQDGENLQPGQELKVVRGPFDAVIHLDRHELTLMLRGLYAGRFRIGVSREQQNLEGTYFVDEKFVQSDDPQSPFGKYWIKLDDQIGIHGTDDPRNLGTHNAHGSICLGEQDIEDVHDILSVGSRVQILR